MGVMKRKNRSRRTWYPLLNMIGGNKMTKKTVGENEISESAISWSGTNVWKRAPAIIPTRMIMAASGNTAPILGWSWRNFCDRQWIRKKKRTNERTNERHSARKFPSTYTEKYNQRKQSQVESNINRDTPTGLLPYSPCRADHGQTITISSSRRCKCGRNESVQVRNKKKNQGNNDLNLSCDSLSVNQLAHPCRQNYCSL